MIIIWGSRLFGKVDNIPGVFHVATKFGHLWYFPLIPEATYLVFSKDGNAWRGATIPFSWKSLLVAWVRAAGWVIGVGMMIGGIVDINEHPNKAMNAWSILILGALILGAVIGSYWIRGIGRCSYNRAMALATDAGLGPGGMLAIGLAYGKLTPQQAEALRTEAARAAQAGTPIHMRPNL